jgi:hypothetical protein
VILAVAPKEKKFEYLKFIKVLKTCGKTLKAFDANEKRFFRLVMNRISYPFILFNRTVIEVRRF